MSAAVVAMDYFAACWVAYKQCSHLPREVLGCHQHQATPCTKAIVQRTVSLGSAEFAPTTNWTLLDLDVLLHTLPENQRIHSMYVMCIYIYINGTPHYS